MGVCCSKEATPEGLRTKEDQEDEEEKTREEGVVQGGYGGARVRNFNGYCCFASMYTQQGRKGINQDAMTMWENFNGCKGSIFCGVFDGHGPSGRRVASHVRDILPTKLSRELKPNESDDGKVYEDDYEDGNDHEEDTTDETHENVVDGEDVDEDEDCSSLFSTWKSAFKTAYKKMDKDLSTRSNFDSYCSGATAVSILKQGDDLVIANLGDSRAILCKKDHKNRPFPLQLTTDMKPNVPTRALWFDMMDRIESCQGRIFALPEEPDVQRIWLPNEDCPGLAMARAFGDYCLKDYGLISTPQVTHRKITDDDDFIVLATDGVWDVLSNHEVVKIVSSCRKRSKAAKNLVKHAVKAWRLKYPMARADDCAVICLFLKTLPSSDEAGSEGEDKYCCTVQAAQTVENEGEETQRHDKSTNEWMALEVVTRANSLVCIPRFDNALSPKQRR